MSATAQAQALSLPTVARHRPVWAHFIFLSVDILTLQFCLFLGVVVRSALLSFYPVALHQEQYVGLMLGVLVVPVIYYASGLYPGHGLTAPERLRNRICGTVAVFLALLYWNNAFQDRVWSRGILIVTFALALLLLPLSESLTRQVLARSAWWRRPVAILGAGAAGSAVARALLAEPALGFEPVVFLDDDPNSWGKRIGEVPVFGPLERVNHLRGSLDTVIIAIPEMPGGLLANFVQRLQFSSVIIFPGFDGLQSQWVKSRDFGGMLGLEMKKNLLLPSNRILKRSIDYLLGIPIFLFSVPLIAVCALWIKLASPGPAFFRQEREGKQGTTFKVWKLRTMHRHAETLLHEYLAKHPEEHGTWRQFFKLKEDPRVIRGIGAFLRRYSIDELPQIWNVLIGEMSLVGPRPFPLYHVEQFAAEFRTLRCSVTPGITGLWQISSRSDGDLKVQETQDTYYIRNWSLWLDLYILLRTTQAVILGRGAY